MSRYIAFISYRHKNEDTETARLLRKGIENAHLPKAVKSGGRRRVFRDTDELPTSSDLSKDIENALNDSDHLIALCSEEYVKSKWCLKEIDIYISSAFFLLLFSLILGLIVGGVFTEGLALNVDFLSI